MGNRKKVVAASLACILVMAMAGLAIVLSLNQSGSFGKKYYKHLQAADKYFASGDYENALIAYQSAMEEEPKEEKPYQRVAIIYLSREEGELARDTLKLGIKRTDSPILERMWETYFGQASQANAKGKGEPKVMEQAGEEQFINRKLLSELASLSFYENRLKYGEASIKQAGDCCYVSFGEVAISFLYYNTEANNHIVDKILGRPYREARPNEAVFQDLTLLFGNLEEGLGYGTLSGFGLQALKREYNEEAKRYEVSFLCGSCSVRVESDENGNILSPFVWNQVVPIPGKDSGAGYDVEGQVVDATTGMGISGAIVRIRQEGNQTGEVLQDVLSGYDGIYAAVLDSGSYTAEVQVEGYVSEYFEISVDSSGQLDVSQLVISPEMKRGQIRIVLEWGSVPRDLDSYLEGNLSDGTGVFVNYQNPSVQKEGEDMVLLDVDDRDGFGPETITINDIGGYYHYYVTDYLEEGTMGAQGATVKVYMPEEETPTVIEAPADAKNFWDVLTVDHGAISVLTNACHVINFLGE